MQFFRKFFNCEGLCIGFRSGFFPFSIVIITVFIKTYCKGPVVRTAVGNGIKIVGVANGNQPVVIIKDTIRQCMITLKGHTVRRRQAAIQLSVLCQTLCVASCKIAAASFFANSIKTIGFRYN